jgi:NAD(P)H-flavin reductase
MVAMCGQSAMMAAAIGAAKPRTGNSAAANSATMAAVLRIMDMMVM